jgi:hypothetical protein
MCQIRQMPQEGASWSVERWRLRRNPTSSAGQVPTIWLSSQYLSLSALRPPTEPSTIRTIWTTTTRTPHHRTMSSRPRHTPLGFFPCTEPRSDPASPRQQQRQQTNDRPLPSTTMTPRQFPLEIFLMFASYMTSDAGELRYGDYNALLQANPQPYSPRSAQHDDVAVCHPARLDLGVRTLPLDQHR